MKSGAGAVSACRRRDGGGTRAKKLKFGSLKIQKFGGFGGSAVCDRIVGPVLGDVGFGI